MKKSATTLLDFKRIIRATGYSFNGLRAAWHHEGAFRQELALFIVLAPTGYVFGPTNTERLLLIGSLVLVLIVELLNSGLEAIVDRVGREHHELAGRAKDLGSAAVLLTILLAVFVWGMVFLPLIK
ncbi:MAG: diacylglycerol kinase [Gammaproteobacteria bacterium]|nr:diacylglycerol kinase [Gammaproteobacteria bacterium]